MKPSHEMLAWLLTCQAAVQQEAGVTAAHAGVLMDQAGYK
jgi:hypothetical protein